MISSLHNSSNKNLLPPEALRKLPQWVCWRWEERPGKPGQFAKVPYDSCFECPASVDDCFNWGSFEDAVKALENNPETYDGLGFVFDKADDLCGVDFDDCIDPETGEIDPNVLSKVDALDSYTEISPSKTGLKVFCKAKLPGKGINKAEIEMYDTGRYFTFTGNHLGTSPSEIKDAQEAVVTLYEEYAKKTRSQESHTTTSHEATLSLDDEKIIEKARLSGNGHKFTRLFDKGNIEDYKSQSEADLALCSIFAFWTGRDADRIAQLFRHSHSGARSGKGLTIGQTPSPELSSSVPPFTEKLSRSPMRFCSSFNGSTSTRRRIPGRDAVVPQIALFTKPSVQLRAPTARITRREWWSAGPCEISRRIPV